MIGIRILFLGNANNPLLINLALELRKINSGLTIDILSETPVTHTGAASAFNSVFALPAGKLFRGIPAVRTVWITTQFRKTLKSIRKKYDVAHMFNLHVGYTRCMRLLHEMAPRLIVTVLGNELYRSSELILKELEPLVSLADHITVSNKKTLSDFCTRFEVDESKVTICRFGLKPLEEIVIQKSFGLAEHKMAAGLPENSFVITCGSNASSEQQHEAVIDSLHKVRNSLPNNYLLVFPLVLGDTSRIELIRTRLTANGLMFQLIEKYLTDDQLAHFRAASDVLIQVQATDQFTGAMQEHMCAGSLVITGDWLPLSLYEESGIQFWKVSNPAQVGEKVIELIADLSHNRTRVSGNMERIVQLSSWKKNVQEWYKLYQ
jgi:glycosyltransferase involved in cell wall biosynthesis